MASTINASSTANGIVSTADASGILNIQSNGVNTNAQAWVNFNGVTTATIRASYNVSSVVRNSTGNYTVNFTNALTDANYVIVSTLSNNNAANFGTLQLVTSPTASSFNYKDVTTNTGSAQDNTYEMIAVFR